MRLRRCSSVAALGSAGGWAYFKMEDEKARILGSVRKKTARDDYSSRE